MEPTNRPYIDSKTVPGDAGTKEWADTPPGAADESKGRPGAPGATTDEGVEDGSPADKFISNPNVIDARNVENGRT